MVKSCCAVGCTKRYSKDCGLHFYRFPKDDCTRRNQWIAAVNRENWKPTEHSWICSSHFVGGEKSDDPSSPAYIPTIFDHVKSPQKRKAEQDLMKYARVKRRSEACEQDLSKESNHGAEMPESSPGASHHTCCTMTELTVEDVDNLEERNGVLIVEKECLKQENDTLKVTNALLCAQVQVLQRAVITYESLKDDDSKVKYYTGLPSFNVLKAIFDFVSPCVGTYSRTALPLFDQFLLVLARLRLNMEVQYLSYHFGIHPSNISRTFTKWINVMYERLKPLIKWPD